MGLKKEYTKEQIDYAIRKKVHSIINLGYTQEEATKLVDDAMKHVHAGRKKITDILTF